MTAVRLLAITAPAASRARAPDLDPARLVAAWLDGGAAELGLAVLLREPRAPVSVVLADPWLTRLRAALVEANLPALASVDPQPDPAVLAQLEAARPALAGVQLRGDPSPDQRRAWRASLAPGWTLGRSVHGEPPADPRGAPAPGPHDYTCVAPIFPPGTAQVGVEKQAVGLTALRRWSEAEARVFALGGIAAENAAECLAAGAVGLAGISLFFGGIARARDNVAALSQVFAAHASAARVPDVPPA